MVTKKEFNLRNYLNLIRFFMYSFINLRLIFLMLCLLRFLKSKSGTFVCLCASLRVRVLISVKVGRKQNYVVKLHRFTLRTKRSHHVVYVFFFSPRSIKILLTFSFTVYLKYPNHIDNM